MKKIILLSLLALVFGCKKDDMKDGGYSFSDIYLLQDDVLVDAQKHTENIGNEGGTITLDYVSFWISHIETRRECEGITITYSPSEYHPSEDALYEKVDKWTSRYKQTVTIAIAQNDSKKSRSAVFRIRTLGGDGHATDLTIEQAGK